ncbi:amidohydrolase family protein [Candidatus Palauibacter sp.]|uniref:amidohydrolase family protein n=1 Tax=Candidatus Palauibacter sp. TaxID=3101350 RepID=UPI003AF22FC4
MPDRREFLSLAGVGGGSALLGACAGQGAGFGTVSAGSESLDPTARALLNELREIPVDDTHCHPLTFDDAQTDPDEFVERLALSAFPMDRYFPVGVYQRWRSSDAAARSELDAEYDIAAIRARVIEQAGETVFLRYLVKELAAFLDCDATLEAVLEARNDRGRDYASYLGAMFADANIENAMLDMGYREGMDQDGVARFKAAISPTRGRHILRVDTILGGLMSEDLDLDLDEIETRMMAEIEAGLDGDGNLGAPSYGMKSYLLPRLGLLKPLFDPAPARRSWDQFRARRARGEVPAGDTVDRDEYWQLQSEALRYLHSLALEACLERDMPMQFHAGDGEAPRGIMRNQDPFLMEEMVRFERHDVMRMPQVILIHAGYPLIGRAAWLTHLYANCHFELSLAAPLIHHGMLRMFLEVMEVVPFSKILFGSDAYHLPEFYWLAAKWGRRFLAQALGIYVDAGILNRDEAVAGARMILHENNRRLYHLDG